MTNILIFDPAETPGGAFSRAVELAAELPEFSYVFLTYQPFTSLYSGKLPQHYKTVRLYSSLNPSQIHKLKIAAKEKGLPGYLLKSFAKFLDLALTINKFSLFAQARMRLGSTRIDIVQANNGIHFLPYRLAATKKATLIYYFRDLQYFAHLPNNLLTAAEKYIFVGQRLMDEYCQQLPTLAPNKCEVIHSPFDVYARLQHEPKGNLELLNKLKADGRKIIICCSRICNEKGQHVIIEALNLLKDKLPALSLIFIGKAANTQTDQDYLQSLHQTVKAKNLDDKVIFLGHRNDPLQLLQYADIAVQAPIYFEALAGSTVEPVQLGIPTISSDIGGANEVLIHGKTGFLFPPGDHIALAKIIEQLMCGEIDLLPIKEQGKNHALPKWSPAKISAQMQTVYSIAGKQ